MKNGPMQGDWKRGEHEAEGVHIHYRRTGGAGKRALVLVHGFTDSGLCWAPVARELESEYDIVMPDMVGHGLSSRASPGVRIDMAADLASLIRALGLERPIMAGHSMGAMVSSQAASRWPDLASALVLEDPPWFAPGTKPGESKAEAGEPPIVSWAKTLRHRSMEELVVEYRREHPAWPEDVVRAMCEAKRQLDPGIIDALGSALGSGGSTWPSVLRSIAQPLLLLAGDPSLGAIVGPTVLAHIREIRSDAEIARIAGVGHLIRFDAHEAFMGALRPFLAKLPSA
jgi:N-formylmaleamate deformylase